MTKLEKLKQDLDDAYSEWLCAGCTAGVSWDRYDYLGKRYHKLDAEYEQLLEAGE